MLTSHQLIFPHIFQAKYVSTLFHHGDLKRLLRKLTELQLFPGSGSLGTPMKKAPYPSNPHDGYGSCDETDGLPVHSNSGRHGNQSEQQQVLLHNVLKNNP